MSEVEEGAKVKLHWSRVENPAQWHSHNSIPALVRNDLAAPPTLTYCHSEQASSL